MDALELLRKNAATEPNPAYREGYQLALKEAEAELLAKAAAASVKKAEEAKDGTLGEFDGERIELGGNSYLTIRVSGSDESGYHLTASVGWRNGDNPSPSPDFETREMAMAVGRKFVEAIKPLGAQIEAAWKNASGMGNKRTFRERGPESDSVVESEERIESAAHPLMRKNVPMRARHMG